jgi:shikimate kinase
MRISLIGMAGSGKSFWSSAISEKGYLRYCCDDMIEERLSFRSEKKRKGDGTIGMGRWMGYPFDSSYENHEEEYLSSERSVLQEILLQLETMDDGKEQKIVVDTAGSVIYTGKEILKKLRQNTTVVYLSISPAVRKQLLEAYLSKPHPLIWNGLFHQNEGESSMQALARCYENLVSSREVLYEKYANVIIPNHLRRRDGFDAEDFLHEVLAQINR